MKKTMQIKMAVVTAATTDKKVKIAGNSITIGETMSIDTVSKYRKTVSSAAKATYVAKVLDALYEKKISVLSGTKSLYVEYPATDGVCQGSISDTRQEWTKPVPDFLALFADVLYTTIHSDNDELKKAMKQIASHAGNPAVKELVYFFCDSYFYYAKQKEVEVSDDFVIDPVRAAYRRGQFADTFLTKLFGLEETTIAKEETKDYKGEEAKTAILTPGQFLEACKNDQYKIDYAWAEDQRPYMYGKGILDTFVPTMTFVRIVQKIKFRTDRILQRMKAGADNVTALGQDYINLTLTGKPGTGKTAMIYAISAATGLPVYTTAGSHNTDEDEFEGKTKMVDGKPSAVPTDALKCFEQGGIFLIEEANLPQAAVIMGALGQAVEFPFILKKNGYETIRRHPLCIFVTTMNVGTVGAKAMSQPFANRFKQSYVLNDPDPKVFIDILMSRTGESEKLCKWVYKAYESVLKCMDKNDALADVESIKLALSMRSCIGALENIQEGEHPKDAVRDSIIGKIAEQDLEMSEMCLRAIDALPDYR